MSDLISRQAAIDVADAVWSVTGDKNVAKVWDQIKDLPSAQLELANNSPKVGKENGAWIPCSERLPDNRVSVIACYREWQQYAKRYIYSIVIGWYARKHSVRENVFSEWEGDCDYDEDEDEFYIQEGWYEFTTQGNGDLMNWYINAEVVAWMPLPEPYKEEQE